MEGFRAHCSFTADQSLWVVMRYMAEGSCLHIMKTACPDGFEESVIATLLREVLKALVYLHGYGHIHRDVKIKIWRIISAIAHLYAIRKSRPRASPREIECIHTIQFPTWFKLHRQYEEV
ncbi:hypothetical protein QJS10_CPA09g01056 [Acorus calamus]|uniref:Protein kinase domain-containing protein n=1 Tax=Acorus calamus TaxID=4465 RepID=A0AAV9E4F4_ACOCL|nr:hypothetical protein QJS10_CPA09g01056 [Acorus calamus]